MARAVWNVDINGTSHEIELKWTYFGGDREVYVDGKLVDDDEMLMRWKSNQNIFVDGEQLTVITRPQKVNISAFDVVLQRGTEELEPDIDER